MGLFTEHEREMYKVTFDKRDSDAHYEYYFKNKPTKEQLKAWLEKKIEWIKKDDPTDMTWGLAVHQTILSKLDRIVMFGLTQLDKEYSVEIKLIETED